MKKQEEDRLDRICEEIMRRDDIAKITYEDCLRCFEQRKRKVQKIEKVRKIKQCCFRYNRVYTYSNK